MPTVKVKPNTSGSWPKVGTNQGYIGTNQGRFAGLFGGFIPVAVQSGSMGTSENGQPDAEVEREDLAYGGICPVCGEKFIDGFGPLEEGESYNGRICVVEKNEESGDGEMLVHLE